MENRSISVIGGGSWATALVKILSDNNCRISWWMRNEKAVAFINEHHHNPNYLRSVELHMDRLELSNDLNSVISKSNILIFAVPAAFLKAALDPTDPSLFKDKMLVSSIKGIVPEDNVIVGEYFHQSLEVPYDKIGVIAGPCHAEEVAQEKLSYLTVASQNPDLTTLLSESLSCRYIKVTESDDIYGTEYASVLKNVFAIASGIFHGQGYGDNFQAVLISNAIREIKRFVDAVHPIDRDIKDSAYLGDLLVTAYSQFSRNRTFGNMIGKGYSVKSAQIEMDMVAEGYYAVNCIKEINKTYQVDMPIMDMVYNVLYENISPFLETKLLTDKLT